MDTGEYYQDDIGIQEDIPMEQPTDDFFQPDRYVEQEQNIQQDGAPVETADDVPEEINDDDIFARPEQFATPEEELNFYKERFNYLEGLIQEKPEVFNNFVEEQVQSRLAEQEKLIEGYSEVYKALQTDPRAFFVKYIPEVLVEYGLSPTLTNEEILTRVEQDLAKELGEDYKQYWEPSELINPMSMSSKIMARQQQLIGEYHQMNAKNQDLTNNWAKMINEGKIKQAQQTDEAKEALIQQTIEQEWENNFSQHMSREEYDSFLEVAKSHTLTMDDVYKIIHFDDYLKSAFEDGREAGAGNNYEQALRRGGEEVILNDAKRQVASQQPVNRNPIYGNTSMDEFFRAFSNGGMPQY